jgi:hypothetical protein
MAALLRHRAKRDKARGFAFLLDRPNGFDILEYRG